MESQEKELYRLTCCHDCPNAVIDLEKTKQIITGVLQAKDISNRIKLRVKPGKPLHHHLLHLAVAGCPNSCSQPQIKDFGVQGQVLPEVGEGCVQCEKCVKACPDQALRLIEGRPEIDPDNCLNCGKCARICPTGAIKTGKTGYRLMIGGKVGRRPRFAQVITPLADEARLERDLSLSLDLFLEQSRPGERFGQLLERIEQQELKKIFRN